MKFTVSSAYKNSVIEITENISAYKDKEDIAREVGATLIALKAAIKASNEYFDDEEKKDKEIMTALAKKITGSDNVDVSEVEDGVYKITIKSNAKNIDNSYR